MIKHVLCNAIVLIEHYEREFTAYSDPATQAKLMIVKGMMRQLCLDIDNDPEPATSTGERRA